MQRVRSGVTLYVVTSEDFNRSLSHHCMQIGHRGIVMAGLGAVTLGLRIRGVHSFILHYILLIIFFSSLAIVIIIN